MRFGSRGPSEFVSDTSLKCIDREGLGRRRSEAAQRLDKTWRDTTHFDAEDDYRTGCRNVSHCQQQQSYSGLCSTGRSYSTYLWNNSWVQTFDRLT